jgi:3-methyladenine DNA glycosylase AlkC
MTWLNKGLKYNSTHKGKYWLSNLALEAKAAITILPTHEQEQIRHQVAHNLQKLYKQHNEKHAILDTHRWNEYSIINQIKRKLSDAKAIITKTDKGNSTIIIY